MDIIERFIQNPYLSREEYAALLQVSEEPQAAARLAAEALRLPSTGRLEPGQPGSFCVLPEALSF